MHGLYISDEHFFLHEDMKPHVLKVIVILRSIFSVQLEVFDFGRKVGDDMNENIFFYISSI